MPLVVNTQHGLYAQPSDRWQRRLPVYAAERVAAAFGHAELVQNPEDVETLTKTLRIPERKVRLLGNGIDLHRFDPAAVPVGTRERLRTEWGVGDDEVLFGTVGRLVREKGFVEILEAAHRMREAGLNARLVVVGPAEPGKADAIKPALVDRARAEGVIFTGQRTDMVECYSAMDVFITASWREGFPRAAMEAAAMGLPTVGSDIRGNRQVIDDGVTGVLVPVRSPVELADTLGVLAGDEPRRREMASAAIERAAAEFDQQRQIERTLAVYSLLSR